MGLVQLKSYMKFDRTLGKWVRVTPPPVDFRIDVYRKKTRLYKSEENDKKYT